MSLFRCLGCTKVSVQVRGFLYEHFVTWYVFLRWGVVCISPSPKLAGFRDCLFNIFASTLHIWRPFLHPQPEDAPCHGDGPTYHGCFISP
jgi:hypothetical protein